MRVRQHKNRECGENQGVTDFSLAKHLMMMVVAVVVVVVFEAQVKIENS